MSVAGYRRGGTVISRAADDQMAVALKRQGRPAPKCAQLGAPAKSPPSRASISRWMRGNLDDYRDPRTGEVNLTALVEGWDSTCADGGATLDQDHPAWEIAVEVTE